MMKSAFTFPKQKYALPEVGDALKRKDYAALASMADLIARCLGKDPTLVNHLLVICKVLGNHSEHCSKALASMMFAVRLLDPATGGAIQVLGALVQYAQLPHISDIESIATMNFVAANAAQDKQQMLRLRYQSVREMLERARRLPSEEKVRVLRNAAHILNFHRIPKGEAEQAALDPRKSLKRDVARNFSAAVGELGDVYRRADILREEADASSPGSIWEEVCVTAFLDLARARQTPEERAALYATTAIATRRDGRLKTQAISALLPVAEQMQKVPDPLTLLYQVADNADVIQKPDVLAAVLQHSLSQEGARNCLSACLFVIYTDNNPESSSFKEATTRMLRMIRALGEGREQDAVTHQKNLLTFLEKHPARERSPFISAALSHLRNMSSHQIAPFVPLPNQMAKSIQTALGAASACP